MKQLAALILAGIIVGAGCQQTEQLTHQPAFTHNPDEVQLITSDIDLFWKMFDEEFPLFTPCEVTEYYVNAGTPALSLFFDGQNHSARTLSRHLNSRVDRRYYEEIRPQTQQIPDHKGEIIDALRAFKEKYSPAIFTNITFVIGSLNTGGVVLSSGQIVIAAEMFSKIEDAETESFSRWVQANLQSPDQLPAIIIHELVHLQQRRYAIKNNLPIGGRTLLDRALLEGSADFITYLVLDDFLNKELLAYGNPKEEELWNQFKQNMNQPDFSEWLYNGSIATDKPADLGYFIGFKIAQHYYQNSDNKQKTIREIIEMKDGQKFLEESGYAHQFR